LDELIVVNHPVRIVNEVLNKIDIQPLIRKYKTGGRSSYHPLMLLKVLVYAYINNIYSSRKIEEAVQQNIHFMWLSGMNTPDHNTINRFRGEKLKEPLKKIFSQVV
jgi:transposase